MKKVAIIGGGFSGISAAAYCAQAGYEVHLFEKNATLGGRARKFSTDNGYVFDMGPSWYWMPDVFEAFFADFSHSVSDFYELTRLDPQYEMIFEKGKVQIPDDYSALKELIGTMEPGGEEQLDRFMKEAGYKYDVAMGDFINRPCHSWMEFASPKILLSAIRMQLLTSFDKHLRKFFHSREVLSLMEFPVLFLGATAKEIPAMYSLMNYAGLKLGTWYPQGGFGKVVEAMVTVAQKQGVTFHTAANIDRIDVEDGKARSLTLGKLTIPFDAIIASADYQHVESQLLPSQYRNYPLEYWGKRTFAPSCLIFYLGFNRKIPNLAHHTLFFDRDFKTHAEEIYKTKKWPERPLFYACCPSQTDTTVAPDGHENVFLLMPIATGIEDSEEMREKYFNEMIHRLEMHCGVNNLAESIDYKRSYCLHDFTADYNAFEGNAYGLANTLSQTAVLKPSLRNKKIKNLYYSGQLTVPGPGVPPSLISGKLAANEVINYLKEQP